jgi:DNA repair protein RadC
MWHAEEAPVPALPTRPLQLRTAADAARMVGLGLAESTFEILRLAHLDSAGALVAMDEQHGGPEALPLSIGRIMRNAFQHDTRRLLIAHNHPSGDPTPSRSDRFATRQLAGLLRLMDIVLIDHLIFARGGVASFRALGMI